MKLAKYSLAVLLLLSVFVIVSAAPLDVKSTAINPTISYDGIASYIVTVTNNQNSADIVQVRPASFVWGDVNFETSTIVVPASSSVNVNVKVKPPINVRVGEYAVGIFAISTNTKTKTTGALMLQINTERPYATITSSLPDSLEVGKHAYNIIFENTGSTEIKDLIGRIDSPLLQKAIEFNIGTLKAHAPSLVYSGELDIAPEVQPGRYKFNVAVLKDGQELNKLRKTISILSSEYVVVDETQTRSMFSKTHTVTLVNKGNKASINKWQAEFGLFEKSFTKYSPEPTTKLTNGNKAVCTWDYLLNPGETLVITYATSYMSLIIAFLILIAVIIFAITRTTGQFILHKEVTTDREAKVLKVKITLINTTAKEKNLLTVEDLIHQPMKSTHDYGTVKPSVIKKESQGTKLIWKIPIMAPGEERVFSYTVKSSMTVLGRIKLPAARLKYTVRKKARELYSNEVVLLGTSSIIAQDSQ